MLAGRTYSPGASGGRCEGRGPVGGRRRHVSDTWVVSVPLGRKLNPERSLLHLRPVPAALQAPDAADGLLEACPSQPSKPAPLLPVLRERHEFGQAPCSLFITSVQAAASAFRRAQDPVCISSEAAAPFLRRGPSPPGPEGQASRVKRPGSRHFIGSSRELPPARSPGS